MSIIDDFKDINRRMNRKHPAAVSVVEETTEYGSPDWVDFMRCFRPDKRVAVAGIFIAPDTDPT